MVLVNEDADLEEIKADFENRQGLILAKSRSALGKLGKAL